MKKLAIGVLSSALILGACSNHSENGDSDNKSSSTNNSTTKSQSNNKTNDNKNNNSDNEKSYKEVPISDIFNDGKEHLVYKFDKDSSLDTDFELLKQLQEKPEKVFTENFDIDGIYNVKNNKGFEYVFDAKSPNKAPVSFTLDKLSSNSDEENKRKINKLQEINLNEYNKAADSHLELKNEPEEISKIFYTKNGKITFEDFEIPKYVPVADLENDLDQTWNLIKDNKVFGEGFESKLIPVEPITINGKTYAGIAKPKYELTDSSKLIGYNTLLITEVPKNTKIVADKDLSSGKEEKYEDTVEGKHKQKQEEKEFDNL